MRKLLPAFCTLLLGVFVAAAAQEPTPPQVPAGETEKPKRPGVSAPGIRIPITKLKPDHVFEIPGVPDWLAIDEHVWVSNYPKNSVTRIDPASNTIVETFTVGEHPCSGLAAGMGSSGSRIAATAR
jgi:YVTN family beta-propeller protein